MDSNIYKQDAFTMPVPHKISIIKTYFLLVYIS